MALGLNKEGLNTGEIYDALRYNAKEGEFSHVYFDTETDQKVIEPYKKEFKVLIDFESMEVGWAKFEADEVSIVTVPIGTNQIPQKPSEGHKEYFVVKIYNKNLSIVNFGSSASSIIQAMDKLHDDYLKANEKELVPVVHFNGVEGPIKWGKARVFIPNMDIVDWKDRPHELKIAESNNSHQKETIDSKSKSEEHTSPSKEDMDVLTEEFDDDF